MAQKEKVTQSPEQIWKTARTSIGIIVILTLITVLANVFGIGYMFMFSNYVCMVCGAVIHGYAAAGDTVSVVIVLVLCTLVLLPYVLGYFQTKKSGGWMVAILVLWCIDTVACVIDLDVFCILFHALGIWELARAVKVRKEVFAPKPPRTCPRCGAPVNDGESFCGNCGAEIPAPVVSSTPEQPNF